MQQQIQKQRQARKHVPGGPTPETHRAQVERARRAQERRQKNGTTGGR